MDLFDNELIIEKIGKMDVFDNEFIIKKIGKMDVSDNEFIIEKIGKMDVKTSYSWKVVPSNPNPSMTSSVVTLEPVALEGLGLGLLLVEG
jgi:hypothetical protein